MVAPARGQHMAQYRHNTHVRYLNSHKVPQDICYCAQTARDVQGKRVAHDSSDTKAEKDQPQKRQRGVKDDRAPEAEDSSENIFRNTLLRVLDSCVYLNHFVITQEY